MAQINSRINNGRVLKIVRPALHEQNLQIRIRLRKSTGGNTCSSSTTRKDNVDVADGLIVC